MRVLASFLLVLLFWASCLAQNQPLLKLRCELKLKSHQTLEGFVEVKLPPNHTYTFNIKGLFVKKVKFNHLKYYRSNEPCPEELKVFVGKYPGYLYISFEKHISYDLLPINLFFPPFPIPENPFVAKVSLYIPKHYRVYPYLPSQEKRLIWTKWWKVYKFRIKAPVLNPVLILTKHRLHEYKANFGKVQLNFFSFERLENFTEVKDFFENSSEVAPLAQISSKASLFVFVSQNLNTSIKYANTVIISKKYLTHFGEFFKLITKKLLFQRFYSTPCSILNGFTLYLSTYATSQEKPLFRKYLLAFGNDSVTAPFFYLVELENAIGYQNLLNEFKSFYSDSKSTNLQDFFSFVKTAYPQKLAGFPAFKDFSKVKLSGEVTYVERLKNTYIVHLILFKKPVFTVKAPEGRLVIVPLKVYTKNAVYLYQIPMYTSVKSIQFTLNSQPVKLVIDPDYFVWRVLSSSEFPVCLKGLLKTPGILVYPSSLLPIYKKVINFFTNLGYKTYSKEVLPSDVKGNIVYLQTSPLYWIFYPPEKGFYFKVVPNPYSSKAFIGYFYASSISQANEGIKEIQNFFDYHEFLIRDGEVVYAKKDSSKNGIVISFSTKSYGIALKNFITPGYLAKRLSNVQLILIGEKQSSSRNYSKFYSSFLNTLYETNSRLILVVDVSRALTPLINDYLQGEVTLEQLLASLSKKELNIKLSTFVYLLDWAKEHQIKVVAGGIESQIIKDLYAKGLEGLTQEELLKLPEVDFYDPAFKFFLKRIFSNSTKVAFNKFFQAEELKKETLAETVLHTLQNNKDYQVVVITNQFKVKYPWIIAASLLKRGLIGFKTILLGGKVELWPGEGDYYFSGDIFPAEVISNGTY